MHIETLKVLCDLADTGSFSRAAARNFITQSAVSQQIRSLEQRYGRELVERSKGHVRLTEAGQVFYDLGKEIIQKYREIEDRLQHLSGAVAGTVRVATVYSVGLYELSALLKRYLQTFPDVQVHLEYARANNIYDAVSRGEIDLGIVAYPSTRPQMLVTPFREDRLVLICAPQHPFATVSALSMTQLNGEKFVGFARDMPTRRALDRLFRQQGVRVRYVMEMDNIEMIKRGVEIGAGVSLVPEPAIAQEVHHATLVAVPIGDDALRRPLGIISKRGRQFTPAVQEFLDFLQGKTARLPEENAAQAGRTLDGLV